MSAKTLQHGLPDTPRRIAFADKTTRPAIDGAALAVLTWLVAATLLVTFWILFHGERGNSRC